jgi:hypothetical protein
MATTKKESVQKNAAPKAQMEVEAAVWNTIHIFGNGETQVIGLKHNGKIASSELKALAPIIAALAEKQQKGTKISIENAHAINISHAYSAAFGCNVSSVCGCTFHANNFAAQNMATASGGPSGTFFRCTIGTCHIVMINP